MNFKLIPAAPPRIPDDAEARSNTTHFVPRRRPPDSSIPGGSRRSSGRPHSIGATIISNPKLVKGWQYYDNSPDQRDMQRYLSAIQLGHGGSTVSAELVTFLSNHEEETGSSDSEKENDKGGQLDRTSFVYYSGGGGDQELAAVGGDVGIEVKAQVAPQTKDGCSVVLGRLFSPLVGIFLTVVATTCLSLATALLTPDAALVLYWTPSRYHPYTLLAWTSQGLFWASFIVLLCPCQMRSVSLTNPLYPPSLVNSRGGTTLLLFLRAIFGWTAALLGLWSRSYIPSDTVTFLTWMSPVPVLLLAWIFLREKIGWIPFLIAILVSFGVGCLVPPLLAFDNSSLYGYSLAIGALLLEGVFAPLILRHLRHVHFALVTFSYGLTGVAGGIYLYYVHRDLWSLPQCSEDTLQAGILCVLIFLGQTGLTAALKSEMVGIFAVARVWFVPMLHVWGLWYMDKPSNWQSFLGMTLILWAVLTLAARKWVQSRPRSSRVQKLLGFLLL